MSKEIFEKMLTMAHHDEKQMPLVQPNPIRKQKKEWIKKNDALRFSAGIELTDAEKAAEVKLNELRDEIITPIHAKGKKPRMNPTIHNFFEMVDIVQSSKLFLAMQYMPKGGHHHLHLTAACHIDFLIELTKDDIVWFSERAN
jgi:hypothetical protein